MHSYTINVRDPKMGPDDLTPAYLPNPLACVASPLDSYSSVLLWARTNRIRRRNLQRNNQTYVAETKLNTDLRGSGGSVPTEDIELISLEKEHMWMSTFTNIVWQPCIFVLKNR